MLAYSVNSAITTLLILGSIAGIAGGLTIWLCPRDRRSKVR